MNKDMNTPNLRKKVLMDLFVSPWSLLPLVGGLAAWMISWAVDGNTLLNLGGLFGVVGGLGIMATRVIFGLEKITEDAFDYLTNQQRLQQQNQLDQLAQQLTGDDDPNTQVYLSNLRRLHEGFVEDLNRGKLPVGARTVQQQVQRLFQAAVEHLEYSFELWNRASRMSGAARKALLDERRRVIDEVRQTTEHLSKTVQQYSAFRISETESELSKLRKELDETMDVARRAEQRVRHLTQQPQHETADF